jgi:hypothetical protein
LIAAFFYPKVTLIFISAILVKIVVELFFLKKVGRDLGQKAFSPLIILIQPYYWLYVTLVGLAVPFAKYKWKGRRVR